MAKSCLKPESTPLTLMKAYLNLPISKCFSNKETSFEAFCKIFLWKLKYMLKTPALETTRWPHIFFFFEKAIFLIKLILIVNNFKRKCSSY